MVQVIKKYRHIYNKLTNFELQQDNDSDKLISTEDILGDLAYKERPRLFLDFYSEKGVNKALVKYGLFKELRKRGFKTFITVFDTKDPFQHKLRAYHTKKSPDHLICELYLRKKTFTAKPTFESNISGKTLTLIVIEWLTLQNPMAQFKPNRARLPGQKYPGLGVGRKVLKIFINMCVRLKTDGLLNIPEHYHNAEFYGRSFKHFNPQIEGYFRAIQRDLCHFGLYKLTWAIEWGCLIETITGNCWKWFPDEQVLPVSDVLKKHFNSHNYKKQVKQSSESVKFAINEEKFNELMAKHTKENI